MLEDLDKIPWAELNDAYGPSLSTPHCIRALTSPDATDRMDARDALHGNIWHQGTIYEATSYAIPFLIEIATATEVPEREYTVAYLRRIAAGHGDTPASKTAVLAAIRKHESNLLGLFDDANASLRAQALRLLSVCQARQEFIDRLAAIAQTDESGECRLAAALTLMDWTESSPAEHALSSRVALRRMLHERCCDEGRLVAALLFVANTDDRVTSQQALQETIATTHKIFDNLEEEFLGFDTSLMQRLLRALADDREACFQVLYQLLQHPCPEVRSLALSPGIEQWAATSRWAARQCAEHVANLLQDEDEHVQELAIKTLEAIGGSRETAIEAACRIIDDTTASWKLRQRVIYLLRRMNDERVVNALARHIDSPLREYGIEALGEINTPSSMNALAEHLTDFDLQARVLKAMHKLQRKGVELSADTLARVRLIRTETLLAEEQTSQVLAQLAGKTDGLSDEEMQQLCAACQRAVDRIAELRQGQQQMRHYRKRSPQQAERLSQIEQQIEQIIAPHQDRCVILFSLDEKVVFFEYEACLTELFPPPISQAAAEKYERLVKAYNEFGVFDTTSRLQTIHALLAGHYVAEGQYDTALQHYQESLNKCHQLFGCSGRVLTNAETSEERLAGSMARIHAEDSAKHFSAFWDLAEMGEAAKVALPRALELFSTDDFTLKASIAIYLVRIHKNPTAIAYAIDVLTHEPQDPNFQHLRRMLVCALGAAGTAAANAGDILEHLTFREQTELRPPWLDAAVSWWRVTRDKKATQELFLEYLRRPIQQAEPITNRAIILDCLIDMQAVDAIPILEELLTQDTRVSEHWSYTAADDDECACEIFRAALAQLKRIQSVQP